MYVRQGDWSEGHKLASSMNYKFPQAVATPLKQLMPSAGAEGLTLMRDMMSWDPHRRPTAQQVSTLINNCSSSSCCCSISSNSSGSLRQCCRFSIGERHDELGSSQTTHCSAGVYTDK